MKLVFLAAEHPPLLLGQGIHRIGSAAEADVMLSDDGIQPNHAELYVGPHGVSLRPVPDASVKVNDRPVDGLIAVRGGDVLTIGQVQMRLDALTTTVVDATPGTVAANAGALQDDAGDPAEEAPHSEALAATRVLPALPRYVLRGISSAGFGRTFPVVGPTVVGRSADCDIQLDHPGLSRQQARLTPTAEGLLVEDLGSTNGTLLNEEAITEAVVAHHGDEIGFDVMRFRLVSTVGATEHDPATASVAIRASQTAATNRLPWIVGGVAIAVLLLILVLVAARVL